MYTDFNKEFCILSFVSNKFWRLYQSVNKQVAAKKASLANIVSTCRQEVESAYAAILRRSHIRGGTSTRVYHWRGYLYTEAPSAAAASAQCRSLLRVCFSNGIGSTQCTICMCTNIHAPSTHHRRCLKTHVYSSSSHSGQLLFVLPFRLRGIDPRTPSHT